MPLVVLRLGTVGPIVLGGVGEMLAPGEPSKEPTRVYLAGGLAIVAPDGRVVGERRFVGRQGRRLLARLATARGPVPAQDLADDLWGTEWPDRWDVALRAL